MMAKKTILLVDDNIYILEILEISLMMRYKTIKAANGLEALEVLKNNKVDLILLDLNMPHMTGIEFFQHIRKKKRWENIPVIFFSGALEKEGLPEKFLEYIMRAEGFIEKPVIPRKIIHTIEKVLSKT